MWMLDVRKWERLESRQQPWREENGKIWRFPHRLHYPGTLPVDLSHPTFSTPSLSQSSTSSIAQSCSSPLLSFPSSFDSGTDLWTDLFKEIRPTFISLLSSISYLSSNFFIGEFSPWTILNPTYLASDKIWFHIMPNNECYRNPRNSGLFESSLYAVVSSYELLEFERGRWNFGLSLNWIIDWR